MVGIKRGGQLIPIAFWRHHFSVATNLPPASPFSSVYFVGCHDPWNRDELIHDHTVINSHVQFIQKSLGKDIRCLHS